MTLFSFRNDIVLVGDEVAVPLALQEKPTRVPEEHIVRRDRKSKKRHIDAPLAMLVRCILGTRNRPNWIFMEMHIMVVF